MKVIIVDDRPFFMWGTVERLKEMEVDMIVMLYFQGPFTYRKERDSEIEQKCRELDIQLVQTDSTLELRKKLDEFYADEDTLLFIDFSLGDTDIFEDKIDIIYAKEKAQQTEKFRIWFYTTSGEHIVNRLNKIFKDHTIPVVNFKPQEYFLQLDYDYIQDQILNENP